MENYPRTMKEGMLAKQMKEPFNLLDSMEVDVAEINRNRLLPCSFLQLQEVPNSARYYCPYKDKDPNISTAYEK